MPQDQVYDPVHNVTHTYVDGKYVGAEPGDVSGGKQRDPNDLKNYTAVGPGNTSHTDWEKYAKDNIANLIPGAVTMAMPEIKGMGVIGNLLTRLGINTGVGSLADMALNANNDKPKMQSVVDATVNAGLQAVPDAANIGFNPQGLSRTSTTTKTPTKTMSSSETKRSNSGSSNTNSAYNSIIQPLMEEIATYVPGEKGKFGKTVMVPTPVGGNKSSGTSSSTVSSGGEGVSNTERSGISIPGISTTQREVGLPGMIGHLFEVLKAVKPYNTGRLSPLQRAMIGLGLNAGRDVTDRPEQ